MRIYSKSPDLLESALSTEPWVSIDLSQKVVYDSSLQPGTAFLQFRVEYQGQTRDTRILERKHLINTSCRIRHRLELKYFHFARVFLNAHQAARRARKGEN